ncbi:ABC transporter substrate-binding protein [Nevskia sp.]|uniref:ABC transporter substrate-binding protein n=1 Tax=Nevskia sp. TaxID=1929292 RepID=UPI0025F37C19|nr:ABC transporter substrate-binding protein [Nevskia sp.]
MPKLPVILRSLVAFAIFLPCAQAAAPADTVTGFHEVLIGNMKQGAALGCSGRSAKIATAVDAGFDLPYLASKVMRRQWKTLDEAQRTQFTATFRELVLATYSSQFSRYGGEKFETLATKELADGSRQVNAKLKLASGNPVNFDYVLREVNGEWRIVNVVADGVSDLAIRASQYDKAFKSVGFDGLIKQIESQTAANKKAC